MFSALLPLAYRARLSDIDYLHTDPMSFLSVRHDCKDRSDLSDSDKLRQEYVKFSREPD
jgi:hypothetical protein